VCGEQFLGHQLVLRELQRIGTGDQRQQPPLMRADGVGEWTTNSCVPGS